MRYIPELQSLCSREISKQCRKMTYEERYYFLRYIPLHLKILIESFPTDFIVWCGNELLLSKHIINYYNDNPNKIFYIIKGFQKDCENGITRRKVIWRKCSNYYCNNDFLDKIIASPYDFYWNLCKECNKHLIYHHKLMKIHCEIRKYKI